MGLRVMSYNIMWTFISCGLRDLVPLVWLFISLVGQCMCIQVALMPVFPLLVISWGVWHVGSLRRVVSSPVYEVWRR
jgi:hypothetical protein